jgi:hypothetical protein
MSTNKKYKIGTFIWFDDVIYIIDDCLFDWLVAATELSTGLRIFLDGDRVIPITPSKLLRKLYK